MSESDKPQAEPQNEAPKAGPPLALAIKDKTVLYTIYMAFLKEGGIFIPTQKPFNLGDEVNMVLTLMDEPTKLNAAGTVVWITPKGAQGNRAAGIGVQFIGQNGKMVRNKMETYLAGTQNSDKPTHTL